MTLTSVAIFAAIFSRILLFMLALPIMRTVWKETKVPNGLGKLRRLIFMFITSYLGANFVLLVFQSGKLFYFYNQTLLNLAIILNACSIVVMGAVVHLIYSNNYRK